MGGSEGMGMCGRDWGGCGDRVDWTLCITSFGGTRFAIGGTRWLRVGIV